MPTDVRVGATDRGAHAGRVWDGVVWSRLGRGDLAWACWEQVDDAALTAWVEAERGRVLRELGLHGRAEEHDLAGLRRAEDPVDEAMLWIGLTADAVGTGEVDEASLRLAGARDALETCPPGPRCDRQSIRLAWVETEVAGLTGEQPPDGPWPWIEDGHLRFPAVFDAGTDFHRAKAALFRGAWLADGALLSAAARLAPPGLTWAVELARADLGEDGALDAARAAWRQLAPPEHVAADVAATPVARRLSQAE